MRVSIGDCRLFVDIEGLGLVPDGPSMRERPVMLTLHGGPGFDHSAFKPAFGELSDVAQLVYYDHRGQGRSDRRTADEWNMCQWADDIVTLCDVLGIVDPVVYGVSFGGMVALQYAIRHPEHPGKVILDSTTAINDVSIMLPVFERLGGQEIARLAKDFWAGPTPDLMGRYLNECMPLYNRRERTDAADAQHRTLETANWDLFKHWTDGEEHGYNLVHDLHKIKRPVLVLAGEDDPVCPVAGSERIASGIADGLCTFERFDDCGHGVWRDQPTVAFETIRNFISN